MTLSKKPFENIEGEGENTGNQHFLCFSQCFQRYERQKSSFQVLLFCCPLDFNLKQSQIML